MKTKVEIENKQVYNIIFLNAKIINYNEKSRDGRPGLLSAAKCHQKEQLYERTLGRTQGCTLPTLHVITSSARKIENIRCVEALYLLNGNISLNYGWISELTNSRWRHGGLSRFKGIVFFLSRCHVLFVGC